MFIECLYVDDLILIGLGMITLCLTILRVPFHELVVCFDYWIVVLHMTIAIINTHKMFVMVDYISF